MSTAKLSVKTKVGFGICDLGGKPFLHGNGLLDA